MGLSINNLLLVADELIFLSIDLSIARLTAALIGMMLLIYGLIFESEEAK